MDMAFRKLFNLAWWNTMDDKVFHNKEIWQIRKVLEITNMISSFLFGYVNAVYTEISPPPTQGYANICS